MATGDRLYHLNEDVWVVAPSRATAAWYMIAKQQVYVAAEDRWSEDDISPADYLVLSQPDDDVRLPTPDGKLYVQTAEEYARACPSGYVVDSRVEDEDLEDDDPEYD